MPAVKKYTRINFQNYPSTSTPLNATNLNKMDKGIDDLDDEVVAVKNTIENMSFDADSISYNNTSSGLQATDVQGAVDEINDNLTNLNNSLGTSEIIGSFNSTGEKTLDESVADYREILILAIDSNNFIFGQAFLPSDYIQSNLNQGIVFSYNNAVSVYSMKFTSSNEVNITARTGNADLMKIIGIN